MDKILTAKDILKAKGYTRLKFNMEACVKEISKWFNENEIKSQIILVPYRFAGLEKEYPNDFADVSDAMNLFCHKDMSKEIPVDSGKFPFFIDKGHIEDVVRILKDDYGFTIEKYKKGTYLVSLV